MPFLNENCWYEVSDSMKYTGPARPGIFLDRDGVIIEEKHYLADPAKVEFIPGAAKKLRELAAAHVPIVLITNQSGLGQGLFDWQAYDRVHKRMLELCEIPQPFDAVYANSHLPGSKNADWRKPNPGMLLDAARRLSIDVGASVVVGDKVSDLEAGKRAGAGHLVHVRTGHGRSERTLVTELFPQAVLLESLADLDIERFFEAVPSREEPTP